MHNRVDELAEKSLERVLMPPAGFALTRKPVALDVDRDLDSPAVPAVARTGPPSRVVESPVYHNSLQANPSRSRAFLTPSKRSAMLEE